MIEDRSRLREALCGSTLALRSRLGEGTGFFVGPGLVLTSAHVIGQKGRLLPHQIEAVWADQYLTLTVVPDWYYPGGDGGPDLALLRMPADVTHPFTCLSDATEPGDELWIYGYPAGQYRAGDSVSMRCEGPSSRTDGTRLIRASGGRASPGHSGSPALNWRTGSVCGILRLGGRVEGDTALTRLVSARTILDTFPQVAQIQQSSSANRSWYSLMSDRQLREAGRRVPSSRLTAYLHAARSVARDHPYALAIRDAPPLNVVYLRQYATATGDSPDTVTADEILRFHRGAQVIGGPGAGKSNLLRHITDVAASAWLDGADASFVPILVHASALTMRKPLDRALADGVVNELGAALASGDLAGLLTEEPLPGVPWLILVDGVDEVLDSQRRDLALKVIAQRRADSPHLRFIVASRPLPTFTLSKITSDDAPSFTIEPFTDKQLTVFAERWFAALAILDPASSATRFIEELGRSRLRQLAHIPLLATMICIVFAVAPEQRLPISRAQLYERFVQRLLDKARTTADVRRQLRHQAMPYGEQAEQAVDRLLDGLREALETLAHQRQSGQRDPDPPPPPPSVPADSWSSIVTETLRLSGLLVERSGRLVFIHHTIQEYLAACHLARIYRPPGRFRGHLPFAPQESWPWRDAEVKLFLAAIWTERGVDLRRPLRRLLNRKNRAANAEFVAELVRQGVQLPAELFVRVCEAFTGMVSDSDPDRQRWASASKALIDLDAERAADLLESLMANRSADRSRRYEAGAVLIRLDKVRGTRALQAFIRDEDVFDYHLRAARTLYEHDALLGRTALESMARNARTLIDDRWDAANDVLRADPAAGILLFAALARDVGVRGDFRHRAARMLAEIDPKEGSVALATIAQAENVPGSVRADSGVSLLLINKEAGFEVLEELSRDESADGDGRLRAAKAILQEDTSRGLPALEAVARSIHAALSARLGAVEALEEVEGMQACSLLVAISAESTIAYETRLALAQRAVSADVRLGMEAFAAITHDDSLTGRERRVAATMAAELSPIEGSRLLAELAATSALPYRTRVKAAEAMAQFDLRQSIDVLDALARTLRGSDRLFAARALGRVDPQLGLAILAEIASNHRNTRATEAATVAAEIDHTVGVRLLLGITTNRRISTDLRVTAAKSLYRLDRTQGGRELRGLLNEGNLAPIDERSIRLLIDR